MPASRLAKWLPGREVNIRRVARKLTQREVGQFVGRGYQTVAKWEHGEKCPDISQMYALAENLGMDSELRAYLIEIARNESQQNFQNDRRFNALCLRMAELSNGEIFKWEPMFIPGIAQIRAYHYNILRLAQDYTDIQLNRGWIFKEERQSGVLSRTDNPTVHLLMGEQALWNLSYLSEKDREEQIDRLIELDALPNWETRIVVGPHPEGGGAFEIFRPDGAEYGSPPFVYTEVWDNIWCIEEADRIARYDDLWKVLWGKSITLREYLNDRRNRLA